MPRSAMFAQCPKNGLHITYFLSALPLHLPPSPDSARTHSRLGGGCRRRLNLRPVAVFAGIVFGTHTQRGHQIESVTRMPVGVGISVRISLYVWVWRCGSMCVDSVPAAGNRHMR